MNRRSMFAAAVGVLLSPFAVLKGMEARTRRRERVIEAVRKMWKGETVYGPPQIVDGIIVKSQEALFRNGYWPTVKIIRRGESS